MHKNNTITEEIKCALPDTQNQTDIRDIPIDKVGIKNLKYPITVKDRDGGVQHTVATVAMTVDLPKEFKGTHMSRFVEVLMNKKEIHIDSIFEILRKCKISFMQIQLILNLTFLTSRKNLHPSAGNPP